tara:strand:- start:104 stop:502 length:399 start_codon:yes stop_codon:yes gene_type:complete
MSDLKITHAGGVVAQTAQGPINPLAPLGQAGSIFADGDADLVPPLGTVFVAITFLDDSTFDSTTGGLVAEDATKYINTVEAAHNLGDAAATSIEGEGGLIVDVSNTFPAGVTIYGRWTEIDLDSGMIIAYIG